MRPDLVVIFIAIVLLLFLFVLIVFIFVVFVLLLLLLFLPLLLFVLFLQLGSLFCQFPLLLGLDSSLVDLRSAEVGVLNMCNTNVEEILLL